jgi:biopolymer transport protein TolQ
MLPHIAMIPIPFIFRASGILLAQAAAPSPAAVAVPIAAAANEHQGIDYWAVMTGGSPVVVSVLGLLLLASVASWAIIVRKALHLRAAEKQSVAFLQIFWKSKRLDAIYEQAESFPVSPVSQVFRAGYVELSKVTQAQEEDAGGAMSEQLGGMENVERALKRATNAELSHLEETVPFLATVASASPFVGLFGTVWGIMGAFHDITAAGNASLPTVAKPISEALIATAVGLFAAIPAVVAYNFFSSRIRTLENEMANFSADFLNILKRHFFKNAA